MRFVQLMSDVLWVQGHAFAEMVQLAESAYPLETGGMLIGYEADDGQLVVKAIIGPGPHAIHRRSKFFPDAEFQQSQLEMHFAATRGRETYLGDWHTHPAGGTSLSLTDKRTLKRIAYTP